MSAATNTTSPGRWTRWLANDRSFWKMTAIVLGAISAAKGIRLPNRWSATQALVDYRYGLVKRGLLGATAGHWLHLERYAHFALFSYFVLAVLGVLLVLLTVQSGVSRRLGAGEAAAVFFSSFAVTYLAHLVGYLDIPLAAFAVLLLLISNPSARFIVALPVCMVGLLIHEMFFLVFLPAVLFSFLVDWMVARDSRMKLRLGAMACVLLCVCGVTTARLARQRPMTQQQEQSVRDGIALRADFQLREDFFEVLTLSGSDNWRIMQYRFRHVRSTRSDTVKGVIVFLPLFVALMALCSVMLRSVETLSVRRWMWVGAVLTACSPLSMYLFGWDIPRWDALACLEAYLALAMICRSRPETHWSLPAGYRNAIILVIALSMATGETLMDNKQVHQFPFLTPLKDLQHTMETKEWVPPY